MFKFTLYSESSIHDEKLNLDRRIGEDAYPVVTNFGMFAADGMGGNAGIRIENVCDGNNTLDSQFFDEESAGNAVISTFGKIPEAHRKALLEYFLKSYSSLFSETMRKIYSQYHCGEDTNWCNMRLKKSGFFGSHALGMVMYNYLLSLEKGCEKSLEDENTISVHSPEGAIAENEMTSQLTEREKHQLQENETIEEINRILSDQAGTKPSSSKRNLIDEAEILVNEILAKSFVSCIKALRPNYRDGMKNMTPFGTTLISALYEEHADKNRIDVVYISAGDSRCYVINKEIGFRQAVDDQTNGRQITSMVELARAEQTIRGRSSTDEPGLDIKISEVRSYAMPCILFCITDGVYDAFQPPKPFKQYLPLGMEIALLNWIVKSDSPENLEKRLKEWFDPKTSVDDSHSLAMVCFGLDSYEEVRKFAQELLEKIEAETNLSEKPTDFLYVDYSARCELLSCELIEDNAEELFELTSEERIHDYCSEQLETPAQRKYMSEVEKLRIEFAKKQEARKNLNLSAVVCVRKDFLQYADWYKAETGVELLNSTDRDVIRLRELRDRIVCGESNIQQGISSFLDFLPQLADSFVSFFTGDYETLKFEDTGYETRKKQFEDSDAYITDKLKKPIETLDSLNESGRKALSEWRSTNYALSETQLSAVDDIVKLCIEHLRKGRPLNQNVAFLSPEMNEICRQCCELDIQIEQLGLQIDSHTEKAIKQYWRDNAIKIFYSNRDSVMFSEGQCRIVRDKLIAIIKNNETFQKYQRYAEAQQKLYNEYMSNYTSDLSAERKSIVMEKGWQH